MVPIFWRITHDQVTWCHAPEEWRHQPRLCNSLKPQTVKISFSIQWLQLIPGSQQPRKPYTWSWQQIQFLKRSLKNLTLWMMSKINCHDYTGWQWYFKKHFFHISYLTSFLSMPHYFHTIIFLFLFICPSTITFLSLFLPSSALCWKRAVPCNFSGFAKVWIICTRNQTLQATYITLNSLYSFIIIFLLEFFEDSINFCLILEVQSSVP